MGGRSLRHSDDPEQCAGGETRRGGGQREPNCALKSLHPALSLAIWLLIQLIVLALAAGEVSLSAGFARPPQRLALQEMLIVQFAASGMLFPLLFSGWSAAAAIILTAAPMILISGYLSGIGNENLFLAWCCVGMWLGGLSAISRPCHPSGDGDGANFTLIALANLLSIGGLILWYLESEFAGLVVSSFFPLSSLLKAIAGIGSWAFPLSSTAVILGMCIIFDGIRRRWIERRARR